MTLVDVAIWATVAFGVILTGLDVRACFYFRHQLKLMGGNWILLAFYRVSLTITAVAAWLTGARTINILLRPEAVSTDSNGLLLWLTVLSGLAVIWLLTIPILLQRLFESHEGREG